MGAKQSHSKGFTLIAALLLLLLLSGIAVGLMYMTNTEARVGGNDLENNLAYYGAEAGMEKMTSDLGNLYNGNQAPSVNNIKNLANFPPTQMPGITYTEYTFDVPVDNKGNPITNIGNVSSGPNQGLIAEIVPMTLTVTAQRLSAAQVRMQRTVEVALIPVFQFGVFSDSDLSYFAGPKFDFAGRVHTNGNLFLAETDSNGLIFHSQITTAKEVIRDKLANGQDVKGQGRTGPVYIPTTASGCDANQNLPGCRNLDLNAQEESYIGGPPPTGVPNSQWYGISIGNQNGYKGFIRSSSTGAKTLQLPFVGGGLGPIEIVRKPPANETVGSELSNSRLFNKAAIRVLLADDEAQLIQGTTAGLGDADDIQLDNEAGSVYPTGISVDSVAGKSYFAYASTKSGDTYYDPNTDQISPPTGPYAGLKEWPLLDTIDQAHSWLRVEIRKTDGTWLGVTREWLQRGFSRDLTPPTCARGGGACSNDIHPNAILMLQQVADRDNSGTISGAKETKNSGSRYNWYPINLYDAREGEVRDITTGKVATSCAPNGIMNVVELDVGNLRQWLVGNTGTNGKLADYTFQNGYVLYFSDRRGELADLNSGPPTVLTGEYGYEDTINAASSSGAPDGILDPNNPGTTQSPEDVDQNGKPDDWGAQNIKDAFISPAPPHSKPYDAFNPRVTCLTVGRKNQVAAARHVLKLVDGKLGNLPTRPDGTGGFTVASENPVYIYGDYNANGGFGAGNAAAAVIADAVTVLSNGWGDVNSLTNPLDPTKRVGTTSYFRLAIAAGKNFDFPQPQSWAAAQDYGTDGGVHNFLRYLEGSWNGTLNYTGSLVSLFYSQYATGVFKCCTTVYSAPNRVYAFDTLFLDPTKLPPGTPMFQDIDNVSYRQDFRPY